MKRCLIMILCVMILLPACKTSDTASFYYPRSSPRYDRPDGVIASEERDIAGHSTHLSFLVSLYLIGPMDSELMSPFPANTKLLSIDITDRMLNIRLSETINTLSDSQFTLACTCMTLTCLELADVDAVSITSGERNITMTKDMITLYDTGSPTDATAGG